MRHHVSPMHSLPEKGMSLVQYPDKNAQSSSKQEKPPAKPKCATFYKTES